MISAVLRDACFSRFLSFSREGRSEANFSASSVKHWYAFSLPMNPGVSRTSGKLHSSLQAGR